MGITKSNPLKKYLIILFIVGLTLFYGYKNKKGLAIAKPFTKNDFPEIRRQSP
jgi:hypothetical protein